MKTMHERLNSIRFNEIKHDYNNCKQINEENWWNIERTTVILRGLVWLRDRRHRKQENLDLIFNLFSAAVHQTIIFTWDKGSLLLSQPSTCLLLLYMLQFPIVDHGSKVADWLWLLQEVNQRSTHAELTYVFSKGNYELASNAWMALQTISLIFSQLFSWTPPAAHQSKLDVCFGKLVKCHERVRNSLTITLRYLFFFFRMSINFPGEWRMHAKCWRTSGVRYIWKWYLTLQPVEILFCQTKRMIVRIIYSEMQNSLTTVSAQLTRDKDALRH